jgi:hypothetical protein
MPGTPVLGKREGKGRWRNRSSWCLGSMRDLVWKTRWIAILKNSWCHPLAYTNMHAWCTHTHMCKHIHTCTHIQTQEQKLIISSVKTLLLVAGMYASAPAPLAGREGVGTSAAACTFLWNTEPQSSPQFGHFLAVKESWKKEEPTWTTLIPLWVGQLPSPYSRVRCLTSLLWWTAAFLTFGGWQAFSLHYKHGISVSLFHNESLQLSDLFPTRKMKVTEIPWKMLTSLYHYYKTSILSRHKVCDTSNVISETFTWHC